MTHHDASQSGSVYVQLAETVAASIRSGTLLPGTRLYAEQVMAAEHGVAVGTVRRELRERGLVTTLPAKGTFVAAPPARNF